MKPASSTSSIGRKLPLFRMRLPLASSLWRVLTLSLIAMVLIPGSTTVSMAEDYQLGPQDKVRIKVFEWRATRDQVFEWTALNDQFTVGADGTLSLPFAGQVKASGLTPAELARLVAQQFQNEMRLGRAPDVSLEVSQFRPFYIVGRVERPGEYPYRPGLTVLQAMSIAGGIQRISDLGLMRLGREAISSRGDLRVLNAQANSLLARRARLLAELNQSETISFPDELMLRYNAPLDAQVRQQEQSIFETRREAFRTELRTLRQLKDYLEKEVVSLEGQLKTEDEQIRLVQKELKTVSGLVEKGLSAAPRQLALERTQAQIEGDRLRMGTLLLKAKQEISRNEIAILELQNKRAKEVTMEMRDTQSKLDETQERIRATDNLLYDSEVLAPGAVAERTRTNKIQPNFKIVRKTAERVVELDAKEDSLLKPGDTVKVEFQPTEGSGDQLLNSNLPGSGSDQRSNLQTSGSLFR